MLPPLFELFYPGGREKYIVSITHQYPYEHVAIETCGTAVNQIPQVEQRVTLLLRKNAVSKKRQKFCDSVP